MPSNLDKCKKVTDDDNKTLPSTSGNHYQSENVTKSRTTTTEDGNGGPGNRVIKSIFKLDPKKLKQLGLDSKIFNALNKKNDTEIQKPPVKVQQQLETSAICSKLVKFVSKPTKSKNVVSNSPKIEITKNVLISKPKSINSSGSEVVTMSSMSTVTTLKEKLRQKITQSMEISERNLNTPTRTITSSPVSSSSSSSSLVKLTPEQQRHHTPQSRRRQQPSPLLPQLPPPLPPPSPSDYQRSIISSSNSGKLSTAQNPIQPPHHSSNPNVIIMNNVKLSPSSHMIIPPPSTISSVNRSLKPKQVIHISNLKPQPRLPLPPGQVLMQPQQHQLGSIVRPMKIIHVKSFNNLENPAMVESMLRQAVQRNDSLQQNSMMNATANNSISMNEIRPLSFSTPIQQRHPTPPFRYTAIPIERPQFSPVPRVQYQPRHQIAQLQQQQHQSVMPTVIDQRLSTLESKINLVSGLVNNKSRENVSTTSLTHSNDVSVEVDEQSSAHSKSVDKRLSNLESQLETLINLLQNQNRTTEGMCKDTSILPDREPATVVLKAEKDDVPVVTTMKVEKKTESPIVAAPVAAPPPPPPPNKDNDDDDDELDAIAFLTKKHNLHQMKKKQKPTIRKTIVKSSVSKPVVNVQVIAPPVDPVINTEKPSPNITNIPSTSTIGCATITSFFKPIKKEKIDPKTQSKSQLPTAATPLKPPVIEESIIPPVAVTTTCDQPIGIETTVFEPTTDDIKHLTHSIDLGESYLDSTDVESPSIQPLCESPAFNNPVLKEAITIDNDTKHSKTPDQISLFDELVVSSETRSIYNSVNNDTDEILIDTEVTNQIQNIPVMTKCRDLEEFMVEENQNVEPTEDILKIEQENIPVEVEPKVLNEEVKERSEIEDFTVVKNNEATESLQNVPEITSKNDVIDLKITSKKRRGIKRKPILGTRVNLFQRDKTILVVDVPGTMPSLPLPELKKRKIDISHGDDKVPAADLTNSEMTTEYPLENCSERCEQVGIFDSLKISSSPEKCSSQSSGHVVEEDKQSIQLIDELSSMSDNDHFMQIDCVEEVVTEETSTVCVEGVEKQPEQVKIRKASQSKRGNDKNENNLLNVDEPQIPILEITSTTTNADLIPVIENINEMVENVLTTVQKSNVITSHPQGMDDDSSVTSSTTISHLKKSTTSATNDEDRFHSKSETVVPRKRRGRPPRSTFSTESVPTSRDSSVASTSRDWIKDTIVDDDTPIKPLKLKRGRRPKKIDNDCSTPSTKLKSVKSTDSSPTEFLGYPDNISTPEDPRQYFDAYKSSDSVVKDNRGRTPRKKKTRKKYATLSSSVENVENDVYVCGSCKESVPPKVWIKHVINVHSGYAWIDGVEPPLDLTTIENERSALQYMIYFAKRHKLLSLRCEKCSDTRKSALGFIKHIKTCGLSPEEMKVECVHCGAKLLEQSMTLHLRNTCPVIKQQMAMERMTNSNENLDSSTVSEVGRIKRKSVKKAELLLTKIANFFAVEDYYREKRPKRVTGGFFRKFRKEIEAHGFVRCQYPNCSVTATTECEMSKHMAVCTEVGELGFFCKKCDYKTISKTTIEEHVNENHAADIKNNLPKAFECSGSEASAGDESSESEGSSGDEEIEEDGEVEEICYDDVDEDESNKGNCIFNIFRNNDTGEKRNKCSEMSRVTETCSRLLAEYTQKLRNQTKWNNYSRFADEWTRDFRAQNYSKTYLYEMLRPHGMSTSNPSGNILQYIPKMKSSLNYHFMRTAQYHHKYCSVPAPQQWNQLNIFEAVIENGCPIMYCGGPITAIEWCPFPTDYEGAQYLAISCLEDAKHNVKHSDDTEIKCLVQIWKWDDRENTIRHIYSIAFDHGPILAMKFCPSGGYIEDERFGLLAVSSYCGEIFVLSLPTDHRPFLSSEQPTLFDVIRLRPSLRLGLNVNNKNNLHTRRIVQISWTKEQNHSKVACGFINGTVAVWDLTTESPLLRRTTALGDFILPLTTFQPFGSCITALDLFYVNNSNWLMVASHKYLKLYDLNTYGHPLEVSKLFPKSWITCGVWPLHWSSFIVGKDEAFHLMRNSTTAIQPHGIGFKQISLQAIDSVITDITYSEWCNMYMVSTESGDIFGCFFRDLLCNMSKLEIKRLKLNFGYTDVVKLSPNDLTSSVGDGYPTKYGVVFCDMKRPIMSSISGNPLIKEHRRCPIEDYPITKICKLNFNPNEAYRTNIAIGYQAGFVRIRQLDFKS